jgi:hypothetical protein
VYGGDYSHRLVVRAGLDHVAGPNAAAAGG